MTARCFGGALTSRVMVRVETSSWGRILGRHNQWGTADAPPVLSLPVEAPKTESDRFDPAAAVASVIVRYGTERARLDIDTNPLALPQSPPRRALIFPTTTTSLSPDIVQLCLTQLTDQGFVGWVESVALSDGELNGFHRNGFAVRQSLRLLTHDLHQLRRHPKRQLGSSFHFSRIAGPDRIPNPSAATISELLRVDHAAFPEGLGLDLMGLRHSMTATRRVMISAIWHNDAEGRHLAGFAIVGRVGRAGYLQRLAVDPAHQAHGIGRALTHDALRWGRRNGVRRMIVNTQHTNHRALSLYRASGFIDASTGLTVMGRWLNTPGPST